MEDEKFEELISTLDEMRASMHDISVSLRKLSNRPEEEQEEGE